LQTMRFALRATENSYKKTLDRQIVLIVLFSLGSRCAPRTVLYKLIGLQRRCRSIEAIRDKRKDD
jgi:hypothetical protein